MSYILNTGRDILLLLFPTVCIKV